MSPREQGSYDCSIQICQLQKQTNVDQGMGLDSTVISIGGERLLCSGQIFRTQRMGE